MTSFFVAVIAHSLLSFHDPAQPDKKYWLNDTTINHLLDGKVNEWPAQKFEIDPATNLNMPSIMIKKICISWYPSPTFGNK